MIAPSFLFSGIDKETLSLSDELNSMGGGDAQACHLEIHAIVNNNLAKNDSQLLWPYENMLGLRNVALPAGSPVTKSMKYVQVDSVTVHNGVPAEKQAFNDIALDAAHWVTEGFNTCIFTLGMRGTGKTTAIFGNFGLPQESNTIDSSLAATLLGSLFENKKNTLKRRESSVTIAISAWSLVHDKIIDLIAPSSDGREPLDFASVECPDLSTAHRILHECRARAPGCLPNNHQAHESQRGHFFLRILLHTQSLESTAHCDTGNISYIYLVDLMGLVSIDNTHFNRLSEEERICTRANNLQLQCLIKVLGEMRTLSTAAATNPLSPAEAALTTIHAHPPGHNSHTRSTIPQTSAHTNAHQSIMKMTSARDSKLTTILAPIIQGNVKNTLLLFLQDGASVANETQNLLNAVNGVTEIVSACLRITDISLRSLGLLQHNEVLGPYFDPTRQPTTQTRFQATAQSGAAYSQHNSDALDRSTHSLLGRSLPLPQSPQSASPERFNFSGHASSNENHRHSHSNVHSGRVDNVNYNAMYSPNVQSPAFHMSHHHASHHTHPLTSHPSFAYPTTTSGTVVTDTSTDYGEIDFDRILAGDFHIGSAPSSPQNKNKNNSSGSSGRKRSPSGAAKVQSPAKAHSQYDIQHNNNIQPLHPVDRHPQHRGHFEVHPASDLEVNAGNTGEHRLHYRAEDLARVEHPPSQSFLQHRKSHYQNEAHPNQPKEHFIESHNHYNETDTRRGDHPPSPPFLAHRRAFNHDEVDPSRHVVHPPHPHHPLSQGDSGRRISVFDEDESPERGPRTHPEVLQVLHDYHDLMEELDNDHRESMRRAAAHQDRGNQSSHRDGDNDRDRSRDLESSMGCPSQIVNDFLQHHSHLRGCDSPARNDTVRGSGSANQPSTPPSAARSSRSASPQRSTSPRQQHQLKKEKSSASKFSSSKADSAIGPSEVQYGAEDSFFSHFQFPVEDSPQRKHTQKVGSNVKSSRKPSPLESSMMADSLFNGSDIDNSTDFDAVRVGSPTPDDNFREDSPSRGYRYRFGSARTSVESAGTRTHTGESSVGIGSGTAAPVLLRGPRLADTSPVDFDTVNFITSSYADFFQDALLAADPRYRPRNDGSGSEGGEYNSDGEGDLSGDESQDNSERHNDHDGAGDSEDYNEDEAKQDLDNTVDSLELDTPPKSVCEASQARTSQTNLSTQHTTTKPSASTATKTTSSRIAESLIPDAYTPYVDSAIPAGSLSLPEAMLELEHLRRTNHSLVESLSEEKQRRGELESKLNGVQDDLLEVCTQCDVQIDTYKLEIKKLKAQMRALCDNQSLTDVFVTFEDNVARLVRENEALRQANLALEAKELDSLLRTGVNSGTSDVNALANHQNAPSKEGSNESYRLQAAKKENLRLVTKLKKCGMEREALKSAYEEVKTKERQFVVNTKIANDCARRLRIMHQDLLRVKKELEHEQAARAVAERDLHCIRQDTAGLREAEAALREERSRHLSELALLRERVREVDHERKRLSQLHRFVEKHYEPTYAVPHHRQPSQSPPRRNPSQTNSFPPPPPPPPPAVTSILKAALPSAQQPYRAHIAAALSQHSHTPVSYAAVPPYGMPTVLPRSAPAPVPAPTSSSAPLRRSNEFVRDSSSSHPLSHSQSHVHFSSQEAHSFDEQKASFDDADPIYSSIQAALSEGTVGQAGLSDAQYLRLEESDGIEPALEVSLTAMHESLIATTPQLLPLFRKLTSDIHTERTRALQKRSQLLNQLGSAQYTSRSGSGAKTEDGGRSPSSHHNNSPSTTKDTNAAYLKMLNSRGLGSHSSYVTQHEGKVSSSGSKKPVKSVRF